MKFYVSMKSGAPDKWPTDVVKEALRRLGHQAVRPEELTAADLLVTWTPWVGSARETLMRQHQRLGGRIIVGENGYFMPDDKRRWTFGLGGTNGRGQHLPAEGSADRWEALGQPLAPWQSTGDHVLILGQRGVKTNSPQISHGPEWPDRIVARLAAHTSRPIWYRPHPGRCEAYPSNSRWAGRVRLVSVGEPLAHQLRGAWAAVGYTTTALVEAVIRGVPIFVDGPSSVALPVASRDVTQIENPLRPEREGWAHQIASWQWTDAEVLAGRPFEYLL